MIGIIAGAGPFAGLDLLNKITAQTVAQTDQEHLPVISISRPAAIPDRTAFLLGEISHNPAGPIMEQLRQLEIMGATIAGIPCNTAHAPPIREAVETGLAAFGSQLRFLNMIDEVGAMLRRHYPAVEKVGVLSTIGTAYARVYPLALEPQGFKVISAGEQLLKEKIQPAIYDKTYGIKACGRATTRAREDILFGITTLEAQGAQAVILGCTELPLAVSEREIDGLPIIDSTLALARALIRAVDPQKLRSWSG
jgi:aspartate racemase